MRRIDPADALIVQASLYAVMPGPDRAEQLARALDAAPAGRGPAFDGLVEVARQALAGPPDEAALARLIAAGRAAVDAPSRRWGRRAGG